MGGNSPSAGQIQDSIRRGHSQTSPCPDTFAASRYPTPAIRSPAERVDGRDSGHNRVLCGGQYLQSMH